MTELTLETVLWQLRADLSVAKKRHAKAGGYVNVVIADKKSLEAAVAYLELFEI